MRVFLGTVYASRKHSATIMGQAISLAQWVAKTTNEEVNWKLERTILNEKMLLSILEFVSELYKKCPEEANLAFKKPLKWETSLKASTFRGSQFNLQCGSVESVENKDGLPFFKLSGKNLSILSFNMGEMVLGMFGENKMRELRLCLEANRDPIMSILGENFSSLDTEESMKRHTEDTLTEMELLSIEEEGEDEKQKQERKEKKVSLSLRRKLLELDIQILHRCIPRSTPPENMQGLNPVKVDIDLTQLKTLAGEENEEKCALKSISYYDEKFLFQNGYRSPPWRQLHGDICYIKADIHENNASVFITANTSGYFINKGPAPEMLGQLNYGRLNQNTYRDLMTLLETKSAKFAEVFYKNFTRNEDIENDWKMQAADETREDITPRSEQQTQSQQDSQGDSDNEREEPQRQGSAGRRTSESEVENVVDVEKRVSATADFTYRLIHSLVKYFKEGDQEAMVTTLSSLGDCDLSVETYQLTILHAGALEVLLNILETQEVWAQIACLRIILVISGSFRVRQALLHQGILPKIIRMLHNPDEVVTGLAAEVISRIVKTSQTRRAVRRYGGIQRLVSLLNCGPLKGGRTMVDRQQRVKVAGNGALALWKCCKHSSKNKRAMEEAGIIPLLAKLLKSPNEDLLFPVVGTLQECCSEVSYRQAVYTKGMILDLLKIVKNEGSVLDLEVCPELLQYSVLAIGKCAEEHETQDLLRRYGGLELLVDKLNDPATSTSLLASTAFAIWKCCISPENVVRLLEIQCMERLTSMLTDQPDQVVINVTAALAEMANKSGAARLKMNRAGAIRVLFQLLKINVKEDVLINVCKVVAALVQDPNHIPEIRRHDGIRHLLVILRHSDPEVQTAAAWTLCPCLEIIEDSAEIVRSVRCGLPQISALLRSQDDNVLAAGCSLVAITCRDPENLRVLTVMDVAPMLAGLTLTTDDKVRKPLAEAITRCCDWNPNRKFFSRAMGPLVRFLTSQDKEVHLSTVRALCELSKDARNCYIMLREGAESPLVHLAEAEDNETKMAAARCVRNMKMLTVNNSNSSPLPKRRVP